MEQKGYDAGRSQESPYPEGARSIWNFFCLLFLVHMSAASFSPSCSLIPLLLLALSLFFMLLVAHNLFWPSAYTSFISFSDPYRRNTSTGAPRAYLLNVQSPNFPGQGLWKAHLQTRHGGGALLMLSELSKNPSLQRIWKKSWGVKARSERWIKFLA